MSTRREAQDARDQLKAAIDRAHKVQARSLEQMDDRSLGSDVRLKAGRNHRQASLMVDELAPKLAEIQALLDQNRRLSPKKFDMDDPTGEPYGLP